MSGPVNTGGHHGAGVPAPRPGPGQVAGAPPGIRERRRAQILLGTATVFLAVDLMLNVLMPLATQVLQPNRATMIVVGLVVFALLVVLFATALATVVLSIMVIVTERALARAAAIVLLISTLVGTILSMDVTANGEDLPAFWVEVARIAAVVNTVIGVLQTLGVAVGIVLLLLALRRYRAVR